LEGVRASLEALPGLEVLVLDSLLVLPLEDIQTGGPTTVIFDLEAVQPDILLSLLQQPGLQLIGIDPETHQALVWSGRQAAAVVAADLVEIVQKYRDTEKQGDKDTEKGRCGDTEIDSPRHPAPPSPCHRITLSPRHPERRMP